ncbi:MAG: DUF167 family protein [Pseudomonadota bacterium]
MTRDAGRPWRRSADGVILKVRLTPKSSRDRIEGVAPFDDDTVLTARVRAVPEKGKANAALLKLVAGWLGVPASSLSLVSGEKSRLKSVRVEGDVTTLETRVKNKLARGE